MNDLETIQKALEAIQVQITRLSIMEAVLVAARETKKEHSLNGPRYRCMCEICESVRYFDEIIDSESLPSPLVGSPIPMGMADKLQRMIFNRCVLGLTT